MSESADRYRPAYWRMIEPWWERISIYDGADRFLREFASAPEPVGHLFAAHWLQSEVRNGGFDQFFANSTGVLAPEAELGFKAIGMPNAAAVIAEQMAWFGPVYPREREDRERKLEKGSRLLSRLFAARGARTPRGDEEFWTLLKHENEGFLAAADRYALENDPGLA